MSPFSPLLRVQHDWHTVQPGEKFWVNIMAPEETQPNLYATAKILPNDIHIEPTTVTCTKFVDQLGISKLNLNYHPSSDATQEVKHEWFVQAPSHIFTGMRGNAINYLDVSHDGSLRIQSHNGGYVGIFRNQQGEEKVQRELIDAHIGDVYVSLLFPSGKVALTAGADTTIRIWDILDPEATSSAATLSKSHKQAVLSVDIIERGRNIISTSRDGTAILWDVSSESMISQLSPNAGCINIGRLLVSSASQPDECQPLSNKEVGTQGKIVLLGCENRSLAMYDLRDRSKLNSLSTPSAVNACSSIGKEHTFAYCTQCGILSIHDIRNMASPLVVKKVGRGPVNFVSQHKEDILVAGHDSLSIYKTSSSKLESQELLEYENITHLSCSKEPIKCVCASQTHVYAGGRDGIVYCFTHTLPVEKSQN